MPSPESGCPLCAALDETALWRDDRCRVILAGDADYPGFCRVIWRAHVREMTDLAAEDRDRLMSVVYATEAALRATLSPLKINLASLGNQVPHLHWHVIPRFGDDAHFPDPVWAVRHRNGASHGVDRAALERALTERLG